MSERVASGLAEVAGLIAPTNTPAWLATLLRDWAPSIRLDRSVHEMQPTKAKMREQLTQMANAATILQRGLSYSPTKEFLELEGHVHIENISGFNHTLRVIGEGAALAAASPRIAVTAGKAKKGRGKALPSGAISPKAFCALIVAETWAYLRGEHPAPRNQEAAAAADAYWRASGGTTKSWGSDPRTGWSYHFKEAQSPTAETLRKEVRRHCLEHVRWDQYLATDGK
jgi:hypothetical protein